MTNTPFHWKCKQCEAEAASSDTDMLLTVIKSHMNHGEHYDFDFWKEIPEPKQKP